MKSKLAVWSWVLPIIGFILYPINDRVPVSILNNSAWPFLLVSMMMASAFLGLIFGIITLVRIKKNSNISGKIQAAVGIIFSLILFIFSLLILYVNIELL